jgi:hypothetical protein
MPVHPQWVTTAFELDGHRIVGYRGGLGITVRCAISSSTCGHHPDPFGGNITPHTELRERARQRPST